MDFGVVGLDRLVGSDTINSSSSGFASHASSNPETKHKGHGSGFLKQERPVNTGEDRSSSNLSKTESMLLPLRSSTFLKYNTTLLTDGERQRQMLSFACSKPALSVESTTHSASSRCFHLPSSAFTDNTGFNSGSFNDPSMPGPFSETRGPFTPSQWIELELQALIHNYMTANVPVPSNLLVPIRKALDFAGFSSFPGGLLRPNASSWGTCYFGYTGNTDSEPGRCRRTDGKKWRCSREAAPDQKYCERHMNRGRNRSRKPVEGQSGHSAAMTSAKPTPVALSSGLASAVGSIGGGTPISLTIAQQQQLTDLLPVDSSNNPSSDTSLGRMFINNETASDRSIDSPCLSMLSSDIDRKSKENPFLISKQDNFCQNSSKTEFGLVTPDALLNPSRKCSSLVGSPNFCSSRDLTDPDSVSQQSLGQFTDHWCKSKSDPSAFSWSALDMQSDGTQLSISTPVAPTDFMTSTSSPSNENATLSPLRLSREFDPIQMGLGVGSVMHELNQKPANWGVPISWETSMGGPLGEVLHNTNNGIIESENSSGFNLMTDGWDHSPCLGSSPTGVLQKTVFASFSGSSTGSSPRADNGKTKEGASLRNDPLA